jgi:hypothetical protein
VNYPVSFTADYEPRRSRLTTFFRLLLAIPHFIVIVVWGIVMYVVVIVAWLVIVFTGGLPPGMYALIARFLMYTTQVYAYTTLLTDVYPEFGGSGSYPVRMEFAGPLPRYSRLKTFFRLILAIPILILRYVAGLLIEVAAIFAWFVVVITGRMPQGLQDALVLAESFTARTDAYLLLLTETYPPFRDDMTAAMGQPAASQ